MQPTIQLKNKANFNSNTLVLMNSLILLILSESIPTKLV